MIKEVAAAITNSGEFIKTVVVKPAYKPKWWEFWKKPTEDVTEDIYINSATMGTMLAVAGVLSDIESNIKQAVDNKKSIFDAVTSNIDDTINALALIIHNSPSRPPKWLYLALRTQFTHEELIDLATRAYRRLGVENFFAITTSLNVTKALIETQEEKADNQETHGQQLAT